MKLLFDIIIRPVKPHQSFVAASTLATVANLIYYPFNELIITTNFSSNLLVSQFVSA